MIGVVINTVAVVLGGMIGLILNKTLKETMKQSIFSVLGLCTLLIGMKGALEYHNILLVIISLVIGTIIGEQIDLQEKLEKFSFFLESKFSRTKDNSFAKGYITGTLLYCVGAMAIMGSLQSGINGQHEILFAKSILDFFSAIFFASTFGIGVLFAGCSVFVYQGIIVLGASWLNTIFTEVALIDMNSVGSLLIIAIGLDLLDIKKLKIANMLPAILFPILYYVFF